MPPDIKPPALHRIDKQRLGRQILRHNACAVGQRMIGRQHQAHLKIKHRRVVQTAARQDIRGQHDIQLPLL